jgi:hypothetical protein
MGQRLGEATPLEVLARARAAREAVSNRGVGCDQTEGVVDPPAELASYLAHVLAQPALAAYVREGWVVQLADLRRIAAFQPTVFTEAAAERAAAVDPRDLESIARVSIPVPTPTQLPAQFDQSRPAWILSSANPNLRVVGQFGGEVQPGMTGFGFGVAILPSVMQVARFGGRLLLRDGYHRAYGFLGRGIARVPVLFKDFDTIEELAIQPGMLPQAAFLGDRPPMLPDYLDDEVAASVRVPAAQKMIVI